ncbi:MAG TPA: zinc-dependent metalloprotease [Fimbriimonadaceae bacterium]|nr:zinc-dependent metalloprotease [Fimbriimonadaceae bacterium]
MPRSFTFAVLLLCSAFCSAQSPIAKATEGFTKVEGLLVTYRNPGKGKVLLQIAPDQMHEYLFLTAIRTGLGSNDVGLDRGSLGPDEVFRIRRVGDKVLFEVPNLRFRAENGSDEEKNAVRESFAPSVLWAGPVMAEDPDGTVLVDLTSLVVSDANNVEETVKGSGDGTASLDKERSAVDFDQCKSFPKNIEFQSVLTFKFSGRGRFVRATVPIADSWSIVQHISIIELPDDGYKMRAADPRIGAFGISFQDYSAPLDKTMVKRFVARHLLVKKPGSDEPVAPLVYYVDNAAPEPIRSALVEGASWWNQAFEAAGFKNAFQVKVLPQDADPLDVRYNVIEWVHRSTRGWSYGASITDPRTGEIIQGHVSLGSLRVRQDRLIFEGLLGTEKTGSGSPDDPVQLALARVRQLAAHETGHTLGLAHNFAASTYDRGSVMDYPSPRIGVKNGRIDVSDPYGVGIGAYDKLAIKYLYSEFPKGADEKAELDKIVNDGVKKGLLFLSDQDARPVSGADPRASLWDDRADAVDGLREAMAVRRIALASFGPDRLAKGEPMSLIQEVFVPVFMYHRYEVDAASKAVGGIYYQNTVNGDGMRPFVRIPGSEQRKALDALLDCLDPKFLKVPDRVIDMIGPRSFGVGGSAETFGSRTSPAFDPIVASEAAADVVLGDLLDTQRLERLVQQNERDRGLPSLDEVLGKTTDAVFGSQRDLGSIQWAVRRLYLNYLMEINADTDNTLEVRAGAHAELVRIRARMRPTNAEESLVGAEIDRFFERPAGTRFDFARPSIVPPGSPIGSWDGCSLGG